MRRSSPGLHRSFLVIMAETTRCETFNAAPLFNLPLDLFLSIWGLLPPYSRASVVFTYRQLYIAHGAATFRYVNQKTPAANLQKSCLLRQLRRKFSNPSIWLCYRCLRFHKAELPKHWPGLSESNEDNFGFLYVIPLFHVSRISYLNARNYEWPSNIYSLQERPLEMEGYEDIILYRS
ncbi:hypothetical protein K469DRAFT_158111 [Zopfia rhizophila CBS 207.26]|uniref:F-box domain-containing protein n=1 Tax=Zopfia rhizophila CBS 207.26 TaxID=1314779 RepID=A0A6A6E6T8_9PEZI|nr:hypothetical protein K469DRAFT_158111 [Zopfia rhizophila CBS 207.26]